ncbi:hypothetical protein AB0D97_14170 [Streptomyces roseus]|uniref:hypothetical protein n=1 Tax=Streptomyces roseus TaxID=66430 RepID=UPI0033DC8486
MQDLQTWQLAQAREKLRAKSRYIRYLQLRELIRAVPSGYAVQVEEGPFERAAARKVAVYHRAIDDAVRTLTLRTMGSADE